VDLLEEFEKENPDCNILYMMFRNAEIFLKIKILKEQYFVKENEIFLGLSRNTLVLK
jgi:hypothetical protein